MRLGAPFPWNDWVTVGWGLPHRARQTCQLAPMAIAARLQSRFIMPQSFFLEPPMQIVLASASPRRALLLQMLGFDFTTAEPNVDESPLAGEAAPELVVRLACAKAEAVQPDFPDALLIAADTTVACDGAILGKPQDNAEALAMLRTLSGRQHQVFTGLAMRWRQAQFTYVESSSVTMPEHPDALLRAYLASGEAMGKAGAYGIQGRGGVLVSSITGDFYNVMGLPLQALWQGFCELGCSGEFLRALGS